MDRTRAGQQALSGWRMRVGEPVARQVSQRSRFSSDQVQAVIGAAFFVSSLWYVVATIAKVVRER